MLVASGGCASPTRSCAPTATNSLYDEALTAYWREDNPAAFEKCVAVLQASPANHDAAHALYLMGVICTTKLSGVATQEVAGLQQTWQDALYERFSEVGTRSEKDRLAHTLADLWQDGTLVDRLREKITQEHFHIVLEQPKPDVPTFYLRAECTFPFPNVWADFAFTWYVNGESKWASDIFTSTQLMSASNLCCRADASSSFHDGDFVQYRLDLKQEQQWQVSLWSNKLLVQGIK
jgi:hypothetical protein